MVSDIQDNSFFWLKRLHSLFGVFPIGVFLFFHFSFNSFSFSGPAAYNAFIESSQGFPLTVFLELGLIAIPVLLHLLMGMIIIYRGSTNVVSYSYYRNWLYLFQRLSGLGVAVFIFYHVWSTRLSSVFIGKHVTFTDFQQHLDPTWVKIFYVIGILMAVYHLGNGLATALMTFGISASARSQKIITILSWMITVGMGFWGLKILFVFI